jgi:hypothetical protein
LNYDFESMNCRQVSEGIQVLILFDLHRIFKHASRGSIVNVGWLR